MNSKKSIQDYTFSEIFDLVEIQKLQDMFSLATGVATIITEPSGTPITKPSGFCGFCMNVVRETEKGLKNCMYSDSVIGSPFEDGPRIQRCLSGGLLDGGISIIVEGKHVANWLLGQVIDDEIAIENILPYAKEIGADQTIFIDELQKVKRMSREQFANICSLLELYVQQLSKYAIHNVALTKEIYQKNLDEIVLVELHNDKLKEMNTQLEEMNSELEELNAETEETNALLEEEVSERKKAEVTIRELNQGLEKQVLERTFQLEELNAVLEEEIAERIKSEELVIQEINFTKAIFESIPGMLYVYNAEGRLVRWNKQHEEMTGYCAEELAGMALADWYTSDEYIRVAAAVEDVFRNGHGGVEATLNIKNGKKLYVRMTGIPLDYNGQTYFTGVGIDIAEEKQSQKMLIDSDARHKEMIANISDVIAVIDNDGIIQYKSPNVTKWFGWRCDELVGHSYIKTAHIEDQAYIKEVFRRILLKDDNVETVEYRYLCKDGSYKNIKLTAINLVHNKLINGILVNYHDISERKHFEKAITQAEASNDAKSTFLANMSHEIRTPLNAIIGINYLIQKTPLSDIQRGYVERTILAARNLLGNVNDVLDFSKIEANKLTLELEVFDLYEVINNVASIVSFNLYEKQLKLWIIIDPSIPQMIIGDAHKLNQILLNIINNSVKFTEQGEIKITVSNKDMSDSSIRLTFNVEDTGIGMKEEQQKGIFSAFSQADNSTTRKYGGTGLGLSISKKLVELMDGHISVSSVEGVGTTFSFTAEFAWKKQCIGDIKRLKELQFLEVLFISDDEHMKAVFKNQFELLGITYDDAEHITEAIQYIQNKKSYHTVLLDWKLLNKHTAIEQIKALILRPDLKIILVSTSREYSIEMLEYDNTISAIIYNPIGLRQLYNKLARIFSNLKSLEIESLDTRVAIKQGHTLKNVRVLIVEDNELNRELVIAILEEYGLIIDSAENGRIAIEKILKAPYDLVLMDLQMPVMDGYEATRKIREMDDFKDLPIIAMSAHAIKGIEEITYEVGMNDYITKPFEVSKMISTLEFWAKKNF